MRLILIGHEYKYAVEQSMLSLFPGERPEYGDGETSRQGEVSLTLDEGEAVARTRLLWDGRSTEGESRTALPFPDNELLRDRLLQRIIKQSFYQAAVGILGSAPAWGALSGVRPAKLVCRELQRGMTLAEADAWLEREYFISPAKRWLTLEVAKQTLAAKRSLRREDICLYVGIPFCPSRCSYCSFISADAGQGGRLIPDYLEALGQEIEAAGRLLERTGARIRTVYLGGGTPAVLSPAQLEQLLTLLRSNLDWSGVTELTVEAGRPDVITSEKLAVMREMGTDRVCVNPQTMRQEVLAAIGRHHTPEETRRAFAAARQAGFVDINMDLIAGLPLDTPAGFRDSLEQVMTLGPENITVHTLAIKKSARLRWERGEGGYPGPAQVAEMLDAAGELLWQAGYRPYYLYRQKYTAGGLENTGWSKPGQESLYNICSMTELNTVVALGAGGATKVVDPDTGRIRRHTNPKYPLEYIREIERLCREKEGLGLPRPQVTA